MALCRGAASCVMLHGARRGAICAAHAHHALPSMRSPAYSNTDRCIWSHSYRRCTARRRRYIEIVDGVASRYFCRHRERRGFSAAGVAGTFDALRELCRSMAAAAASHAVSPRSTNGGLGGMALASHSAGGWMLHSVPQKLCTLLWASPAAAAAAKTCRTRRHACHSGQAA